MKPAHQHTAAGNAAAANPSDAPATGAHPSGWDEITLDLMDRRDVGDLLDTILARATELAGSEHGYIFVADGEAEPRAESVRGAFEGLRGQPLIPGVGLAGVAWDTAAPIAIGDYDAWEGRDPDYPTGVLGSGLCVPLTTSEGHVVGVIGLAFTGSGRTFDDEDIERLTGFARLAAMALQNARLHEGARRELDERRRAEEALRQTEENYRSLVELSPDGIVVHQDGRIAFANGAAARALGVDDPSELLHREVLDFIHPDSRPSVLERLRHVKQNGRAVPLTEHIFLRADGSSFPVQSASSRVTFEGRSAVQGVFRDVSDRQRAEEALRDAEEQFRLLVEQLPVVTYREALDDVTVMYVSPQIQDFAGYSPAEWTADPDLWQRSIHPDDRDAAVGEHRRTEALGAPYVAEYRLIARDGSVRWLHDEAVLVRDERGSPRFWHGVMVDVTDRKAAQLALEHAEDKYRSLVERLPTVTYTFANPTLPYESTHNYVSPQVRELLGCEPEEWLASETAWRDFVHPNDVDEVDSSWRAAGFAEEPFDIEYRMVRRDGQIIWVREQSAAVRDKHGVARFWQGVIGDITEQRDARRSLEAGIEQEREVSRRLRALDEMKNTFLAAVSHELRTPLSAILGLALTLDQDEFELRPQESRELLGRLASNARKLDRLLSELLDLDRLTRGIVEPRRRQTDVAALLLQTVENFDPTEVRRPRLDLEPVTADIDPAKVERIVENLLANAIRYTPADGEIWVRLRSVGDAALISVDDEGPGIPEDLRAAVFEPFRQVPGRHAHAPGVGIGLSLVSRFAELHGGRAWVEPREGGGSSFRVLLPSTAPDHAPPAARAG